MINTTLSAKDTSILRALGARLGEIGTSPVMDERRRLWKKMNALQGERPMVYCETIDALDETMPLSQLACESEWARGVERGLRDKIFQFEVIGDDRVQEPRMCYTGFVSTTNYGVEAIRHQGDDGSGHGSYTWEPPIKDLATDLPKLRFREYTLDAEATLAHKARLEEVFEGVLPVVPRGNYWWTLGLTWAAIELIGLENLMLAMYDQPDELHALMAFLRDDHQRMLDWYEQSGLLTPNNQDDYIGSGGCGYTDLLPQSDYVPGQPARLCDLWELSESQETVGVSADMFEEFVFPYQLPIISRAGFACYGCCEPLDKRWHIVKQIPNLRRVSVSPWSDVEVMAENLGHNYVFSRKPNPAYISTKWEEDVVREDLRKTVVATKGLNVEIVLKDVHTVCQELWRYPRWVTIAREVIDEVYG